MNELDRRESLTPAYSTEETPPPEAPEAHEPPPAAPIAPERDAYGRFRPGNRVAVTTGFDAKALPAELRHLDAEVKQFVTGCLVDEADPDVPTRRAALLNYRARLHRRIIQLDAALELRGLVDKRGRLRAAWLQRLEGMIGTARSLDAQLGLDRKARAVHFTERLSAALARTRTDGEAS